MATPVTYAGKFCTFRFILSDRLAYLKSFYKKVIHHGESSPCTTKAG
jgi:hypothetical protein